MSDEEHQLTNLAPPLATRCAAGTSVVCVSVMSGSLSASAWGTVRVGERLRLRSCTGTGFELGGGYFGESTVHRMPNRHADGMITSRRFGPWRRYYERRRQ